MGYIIKNPLRWILLAVTLCGIAAGFYLWRQSATDAPPPPLVAQPGITAKPAPEAAPQIRFPVPPVGDSPSLPALDQSDSSMRTALAALFGRRVFEEFFTQRNIVRRIVATVDNLPREKVAQRLLPVKSASGPFLLAGDRGDPTISPANAARYLPFITIAEAVDTGALVAAYVRYYPLFEQAYRELGYPTEYFNDRLVQAIDHLLKAPNLESPVRLVQRKVLYEYADAELEARSSGEKIMMRLGPQNSSRLKAKLRDIRRQLTGQTPKS